MPPIAKNQLVELEITGITHEGNGVGRFEGMAVFVPLSAVGDKLLVKVVKTLKSHAFARIEEILEPSPHRVPNDCPVYKRCGGCSLRHMSYESEIAVKEDWVVQNLRRIGGINIALDEPIPCRESSRYRNKAQFPIRRVGGKIRVGFFARRSHELIPVEDCLLQPAFFGEIAGTVCCFIEKNGIEPYDEATHSGLVRHLYIRHAEATGQVMVCLVINGDSLPRWEGLLQELKEICPGLATLVLSVNKKRTNVINGEREIVLYGDGVITDILCGVRVNLSPLSFYQVNRSAAEELYNAALEYADPQPEDVLLDLYCGAGTIGLSMAGKVKELVGVEIVESAVENARQNAAQNGIANARFFQADARQAVERLEEEGLRPDIVVLDPPRKGAEEDVLRCVAEMSPEKIVYISCNSATLARDARLLEELGYKACRTKAVDLFPRTAHVESVLLLEKRQ